jgi:hypothetical protein
MTNYTLLATDIDGTLLDHHGRLPAETLAALRCCAERGMTIALATGRNLTVTRPIALAVAEAAGGEIFLILQDGCLVMRFPAMQVLQYHNLPLPKAQAASRFFLAQRQPIILFDPVPDGQRFTLHPNGPLSDGLSRYIGQKQGQYTCQPAERPLNLAPSKIVTIDGEAKIAAFYSQLGETLPGARILKTKAVHLDAWFLEIGALLASKARALRYLAQYLGRDLSEVVAVGDEENDIGMIEAAGLGVAMGNASEPVKAVAGLIIGPNSEGGLARFLQTRLN